MKVREIMTADPVVVTTGDSVATAAVIMRDAGIGMVPVVDSVDKRRIRGVITDRDITVRHVAAGHVKSCSVKEHMTAKGLNVVHPDSEIHDVLGRMRRDQIRRLPVVDEHHHVIGIIALADISLNFARLEPETFELAMEGICAPNGTGPEHQT